MKKSLIGGVVLGIVLVATAFWWLTRGNTDADGLELHGNVDVRQVSLAFDGSGRVLRVTADEGDVVKPGALLAVLDTATLSLEARRAEAETAAQQENLRRLQAGSRPEEIQQAQQRMSGAQADATRAAGDLRRLRAIWASSEGHAVSAQDVDHAASAAQAAAAKARELAEALQLARKGPRAEDIAAAQAQVNAARAGLALTRHRIGQGELRAPQGGVVRARLLEPGDMASPQKPVFELALTSPKWIRVYVSETELGRVKPGMAAQVTSDSAPDRAVAGRVGYISSVAEFTPKSVETEDLRTSLVYEVRVRVEDPAGVLRLGQPVTVRLQTGPAR